MTSVRMVLHIEKHFPNFSLSDASNHPRSMKYCPEPCSHPSQFCLNVCNRINDSPKAGKSTMLTSQIVILPCQFKKAHGTTTTIKGPISLAGVTKCLSKWMTLHPSCVTTSPIQSKGRRWQACLSLWHKIPKWFGLKFRKTKFKKKNWSFCLAVIPELIILFFTMSSESECSLSKSESESTFDTMSSEDTAPAVLHPPAWLGGLGDDAKKEFDTAWLKTMSDWPETATQKEKEELYHKMHG